ncbi:MAG TPA: copper-binding protein [Pyrinomonadaceae bacterium]|nr:copper-binding protein [Pyrinomonadaceae bacterium]
MRRILLILTALLIVATSSTGQELRSETKEQPARYFRGVGRVVSIDEDKSGVTINHQTIEGYMPAMTMHFKAENPKVIGDVAAGERVRFTLKDTPELTRLVHIQRIVPARSRRKQH